MNNLISINVLTTHKNENRQRFILNTWGKDLSNLIFWTDKPNEIGLQIPLTENDSYRSGAEKQVRSLNRIKDENTPISNSKWIFFCDDDTFVNYKNLVKFCQNADENNNYGHTANSFDGDRSMFYFSGGAGFLISNKNLKLNTYLDFIPSIDWGDVHVGIWLKKNKNTLIHEEKFNNHSPETMNKTDLKVIKEQITFHYIKTEDQFKYLYGATI